MKLLITCDLHQFIPKWNKLVDVVTEEKPRFVLIAGDLLPKTGGHEGQKQFFKQMRQHLASIQLTGTTTLLYFGNDDHHILEPQLDQLASENLCVNMNNRVHRAQTLTFCGMNRVRDYPFGCKHWCASDGEFIENPICGQGMTLNEHGEYIQLPNLRDHLLEKPSLTNQMNRLKNQLKPGEIEQSIWIIHNPRSNLRMDICADGNEVGSPNILQFITDNQPLLGCSGHIHESPYQPRGKWIGLIGDTIWIQPGQMGERLHYVTLEITNKRNIQNIRHSVLGTTTIEFRRFKTGLWQCNYPS